MRTFGGQPNFSFLFLSIMQLLPMRLRFPVADMIGGERIRFVQQVSDLAKSVAKELVEEKKAAHEKGIGGKDILSLCVQANMEQNARGKMDEGELLSQLQYDSLFLLHGVFTSLTQSSFRTIAFAGHETTSTATTWVFYEIAKRPAIQERLRAEIQAKRTQKLARNDPEWNWKDFEEMEYLTAVMKVRAT